jgi:hypothetical protein
MREIGKGSVLGIGSGNLINTEGAEATSTDQVQRAVLDLTVTI